MKIQNLIFDGEEARDFLKTNLMSVRITFFLLVSVSSVFSVE